MVYFELPLSNIRKSVVAKETCDTPCGTVRAEYPLGKVFFFTKLAQVQHPQEREYVSVAMENRSFSNECQKIIHQLGRCLWILLSRIQL